MTRLEVVVVGAGPAGLHAALSSAESGCRVLLIDNGARLGGQFWRHMPSSRDALNNKLHHNFARAKSLFEQVTSHSHIEVMQGAQIWSASLESDAVVLSVKSAASPNLDSTVRVIRANTLILATGAHDRPLPFPGWEIPGVMTPGGAQSLLKGHGVNAGKKMVIAGSGPFLLPVASSLADQGVEIAGLFEARSPMRWAKYSATLLWNMRRISEALHYTKILKRHGIQTNYRMAVIQAHPNAEGVLEAVTVARIRSNSAVVVGSERRIECDAAAIGWGFTPDVSLATALGLPMKVDIDGAVVVSVDDGQLALSQNSIRIYVAGEITGIGGADLAACQGTIAGLSSARDAEKISQSQYVEEVQDLKKSKRRAENFATALKDVYSVDAGWKNWVRPTTLLCRCEEVTCEQVSDSVERLGALSVRDVKMFTRAGMGMCQARICGRILADHLDADDEDRIRTSSRPIIAPISLGELASEPLL